MSPAEVAALFRVTPKAVSRWADDGLIPSFRTPAGTRRFRRAEVERVIAERTTPASTEAVGA